MEGVNAELAPLCMSAPPGALIDATVPLGVLLFRSVISWRRWIPFDLHSLTLVEVTEGSGFHERSRSLLHRSWEHKRSLVDRGDDCEITDEVTFEPRFGIALAAPIVKSTFERRHRHLREWFGTSAEALPVEASMILDISKPASSP